MYGNLSLSQPRAIKYSGSPFLEIPITDSGEAKIQIIYDSSYDSSVAAFDYINGNADGFIEQMDILWGENKEPALRIHGLNFMYGERKLDFQFWYY